MTFFWAIFSFGLVSPAVILSHSLTLEYTQICSKITFFERNFHFFHVKKAVVGKAPLHMIIFIRVVYKTSKSPSGPKVVILSIFGHSGSIPKIFLGDFWALWRVVQPWKNMKKGVSEGSKMTPFELHLSSNTSNLWYTGMGTRAALRSHSERSASWHQVMGSEAART